MDLHFKTLETIYTIVKDEARPLQYPCRPREIILRQFQDWDIIQAHLEKLETMGLIHTRQEDTLTINITAAGIEQVNHSDSSGHLASGKSNML